MDIVDYHYHVVNQVNMEDSFVSLIFPAQLKKVKATFERSLLV